MSEGKSAEPHLNQDQVRYFERAMDAYDSVKGTPAENDFFAQIEKDIRGKELLIAKHKVCSHFMETYIKVCPVASLERVFKAFQGHFLEVANDKFASRAIQLIVEQVVPVYGANVPTPTFPELVANLLSELTPHAAEMAEGPGSSHVVRAILASFSTMKSLAPKIDKFARVIIRAFLEDPSRARSIQFSATLQSITALDPKLFQGTISYLLRSVKCDSHSVCDKSESRLIEKLIETTPEGFTPILFENVLKNEAGDIAFDRFGNFVIQRWLENAVDEKQIEVVISQLLVYFHDLLNSQIKVLCSAANAAIHCPKAQQMLYDALAEHAGEENIILHALSFGTYGSKFIQWFCHFKLIKPLNDAMLQLGHDKLFEISMQSAGSFFMCEYLQYVPSNDPVKMKVIRRLIPKLKELALDQKIGTYVAERCFTYADMKVKAQICGELNDESIRLGNKNLWKLCKIDQFKTRRAAWEKEIESAMRRAEAMSSILEEDGKHHK